jgi:glutaredoxin
MAWNWLQVLWPRKKLPHWQVVMYTRQGCHLCEQAWEQLEQARQRYEFALRQVDVDGDPHLVREYGECVPVVVVNGRVRFRGIVNPVLLKRLLSSSSEDGG